jgi:hypothetical protein
MQEPKAPTRAPFCWHKTVAAEWRITDSDSPLSTQLWHSYRMKTKNMRELEKMWAKKASEQSNPQQKTGTPTRQSPTHTTRTARKASRGR